MTLIEGLLLVGVGAIAGSMNVLAGGGSLLTMPLLIFMGLPSAEANASNRVAVFIQNMFAIRGFKSKGVAVFPYSYWVGISASAGAVLGSMIAVDIEDELFNRILAVVMVLVMSATVFKPLLSGKTTKEIFNKRKNTWSIIAFFFIGIYGGFIQAGVGFLIIATLSGIHGLSMAKTNSIKVFLIFCYTFIALGIFIFNDLVRWEYGLVLAIGNAAGGWFMSRWSVSIPDKYVRAFLLVTVSAFAIKLWFF